MSNQYNVAKFLFNSFIILCILFNNSSSLKVPSKANKFICAVNLGMDRIELFKINYNNTLSYIENLSFYCTKVCSPRNLEFSKNGKFTYVICKNSSEVIILKYLGEEGFKLVQYIHVLPNGFGGQNFGSAIKISPCNKSLIIANEKSDTLTIYFKNPDGTLKLLKNYIFIPSPTCIKFK